jgi:hypothetical protein
VISVQARVSMQEQFCVINGGMNRRTASNGFCMIMRYVERLPSGALEAEVFNMGSIKRYEWGHRLDHSRYSWDNS